MTAFKTRFPCDPVLIAKHVQDETVAIAQLEREIEHAFGLLRAHRETLAFWVHERDRDV